MAPLPNWLRRKAASTRERIPANWEEELDAFEKEARRAPRAFQGTPLNRAGDLCLRAGDHDRALGYYGRAIDALLGDGQREAARGVANKIIRVHPQAVRTLCTLTWLDLGSRHMATALLHLRDYVAAAKRRGQEYPAGDQIVKMARVMADGEFLAASADSLDQLGFAERAAEVREWVAAGAGADAITDAQAFTTFCLEAAVGSQAQPGQEQGSASPAQ
jgi:tetratricopeptide (TPR) repeat protein